MQRRGGGSRSCKFELFHLRFRRKRVLMKSAAMLFVCMVLLSGEEKLFCPLPLSDSEAHHISPPESEGRGGNRSHPACCRLLRNASEDPFRCRPADLSRRTCYLQQARRRQQDQGRRRRRGEISYVYTCFSPLF